MSYGSSLQKRAFYALPYAAKNIISSAYGWGQKRQRHQKCYQSYFNFLQKSQWYSEAEAKQYQLQKLRDFLIHAGRHSPYYRDLFQQCRFVPEKLSDVTQLGVLPILDKPTFRKNLNEIISTDRNLGQLHWVNTSGTTGLGLRFPETLDSFEREYAFRFHNYATAGIECGHRWAICAGHPVASPDRNKPPFWVHDYVNNWLLLSSYHLKESNLQSYVHKLKDFKPALIGGYPSSVYMLALANEHFKGGVTARAVFTASETLFDYQKEVIERSFGCNAYTYYGNGERCGFISECEKRSLHVKLEHSYVEILDDEGQPAAPGEPGRMICTGFGNYATPFVRYEIGDVAALSPRQQCECGRNGLLLESILGRTEDYVLTPDGRFIGRLDHLFKDAGKVRLAQIVQEKVEEVILKIVKEPGYSDLDEKAILTEARLRLGPTIEIKFEYVEDIDRTKSGKFKFVVSKIKDKRVFGDKTLAVPA